MEVLDTCVALPHTLAFAFLAMLPLLFLLKRMRPRKVELEAE
jgi:hypothetical protein